MNKNELSSHLQNRKGAEFVTICTETLPKVLKKDRNTGEPNQFGQVRKLSRINGIIGFRYENSVNNQRGREGLEVDFEAKQRQWGEHVMRADGGQSCLIAHKEKTYLEMKVEKVFETVYLDGNGVIRTREELSGILPKRAANSGRQEVEKAVILRDFALSSIREIRISGTVIKVSAETALIS
jgi:hypothetical protein